MVSRTEGKQTWDQVALVLSAFLAASGGVFLVLHLCSPQRHSIHHRWSAEEQVFESNGQQHPTTAAQTPERAPAIFDDWNATQKYLQCLRLWRFITVITFSNIVRELCSSVMVGDSISHSQGTSTCTSLWSLCCPSGLNSATERRRWSVVWLAST